MEYLSGKVCYEKNGMYINVFNPNSWACENIVRAEIAIPRGILSSSRYKGFYAVCGDERIRCDVEALDVRAGNIRRANIVFCTEADALAFKSYRIEGVEEHFDAEIIYDSDANIIESKYYSVKLDGNGITNITDKTIGKAIVNSDTGSLFKGIINGIPQCSTGKWKVRTAGKGAEAIYWGDIGGVIIIFTLNIHNDTKLLDCSVKFIHHGERIGSEIETDTVNPTKGAFRHEDKLCFAFKPALAGNALKMRDLPFMVSASNADDKYIQGNYWTAVTDNTDGIAVFNKGAMCSVYENGELLIPLAYANPYIWGDRYLYGEYTHEFAIMPFSGAWHEADIHRNALAYEYPFAVEVINRAVAQSGQAIIAPIECELDRNAVLSALYSENGSIYARIYEYEGKRAAAILKNEGMSLEECNLLGEPVSSGNANGRLNLGKYQIKSYRLK